MTTSLRGKRVLITRPEHQSDSWRAQLEAAGAEVDSIPMLEIEAITGGAEAQRIRNHILDFDRIDHAIFVSRNAVQLGFDWLDDYWPQLPLGPRYYAIGTATGRALSARGVNSEACGGAMDSEELLALPALQQVTGQRVLIFRGCGGRPVIGETLRARGARVDYCEIYRRRLPTCASEQLAHYQQQPHAISVHSGETLANLAQCIEQSGRETLRNAVLICPSQRVCDQALGLGFTNAYRAENAGDQAMLAALQETLAQHRG